MWCPFVNFVSTTLVSFLQHMAIAIYAPRDNDSPKNIWSIVCFISVLYFISGLFLCLTFLLRSFFVSRFFLCQIFVLSFCCFFFWHPNISFVKPFSLIFILLFCIRNFPLLDLCLRYVCFGFVSGMIIR